jgi:phenylalanyl-tRNA synthetase beta chain
MKVSYRWLRDLAPGLELDAHAVADRLAERGAPIEEMAYLAEGLQGVVVARVDEVRRHPNADRLSLCRVDSGGGVLHDVVCGAPNVRAGHVYPFAPVGTTLPGNLTIKKAKIRGEVSEGMLCSARELGLGTDHSGILELPSGPLPGARFVEALGLDDWRLDVEVTANRGDLLSHLGIAREVAPGGDASLLLPAVGDDATMAALSRSRLVKDPREATAGGAVVRIEDGQLCRRYLGAIVRGLRVGPSPAWLQARLRAAGARPINNVVDATNYVLLELGQPLHAFDLARLAGGTIVVRTARESERRFRTLDGVERTVTQDMLMICDAERPVAVAGVMGGEESEVTDETMDVLLECALFDPKSIRATRRALGLSTDASYRFERGVDPDGMERALWRALEVILNVGGGTLEPEVADCCPSPWTPYTVPLRLARVERVLGVPFDENQVRALLEPLGFGFVVPASRGSAGGVAAGISTEEQVSAGRGEPAQELLGAPTLTVAVPGARSYDVTREIDLIEEIARTHGFDRFPSELGAYRPGTVPDHPLFRVEDDLRRMLAERGLYEAQTPAFVPEGEGEVRIPNPVSREESFLRGAVLPSLLRRVEHNFARGERDVRLFELATAFASPRDPGGLPQEAPHLAAVLTGRRAPGHWSGDAGAFDLWDIKGLLEEVVLRALPGARVLPGTPEEGRLAAGESWLVRGAEDVVLGWGGRIAPAAIDAPAWAAPVFGLELSLPHEPEPPVRAPFRPLASFPAVERDLALVVADAVAAERVLTLVHASGGEHLERVELFDLYRGKGVPDGSRSLAYRLRFQSPVRTLTDEEVDRAVAQVVRRLADELDVRVRG